MSYRQSDLQRKHPLFDGHRDRPNTEADGSGSYLCPKLSAQGRLEVDINSGGSGGTTFDGVIKGNDGDDGAGTERTIKTSSVGEVITADANITVGNGNIANGSLQSVLLYGKDSTATLRPAETTTTGKLLVDVSDINKSGKLTATPSLNSFQICGYREDTNNFHTIKVSNDGTQYVNDSTLNAKISKGDGVISSGTGGLQQMVVYGKDGSGNLDPLLVDAQGHLEVNIEEVGVQTQAQSLPAFQVCGHDSTGNNLMTLNVDTDGSLINHPDPQVARGTFTTGSPFASGSTTNSVEAGNYNTLNFHFEGSMGGSHAGFIIQGSNNNTDWYRLELALVQTIGSSTNISGSISRGFKYYRIENGGVDTSITASLWNLKF